MPHPSRHTAKRRLLTAAAVLLAVLLAAGAAGYGLFTGSITDRDSVVCIPENTSFEALCDTLSAEGRITRPGRFRIVARAMGADRKIRSGRYELHAGMSAHRIVSMLRSGSQTPLRVTFNNIRTMPQLASVLGRQLRADSAAFAAMLLDDSVAARYGFRPEEFIGMFIPDTYEVYWTVSPDAFAERMNREYRRFWSGTRQERLRRTGLTEKEVAILASIIDEETNRTDEMPVMAGVYINRLHRGIPCRPTHGTLCNRRFHSEAHPQPTPESRFAVQHLPACRIASGTDTHALRGSHRCSARLCGTRLSLLLRPARLFGLSRVRAHACRTQPQRPRLRRCSRPPGHPIDGTAANFNPQRHNN